MTTKRLLTLALAWLALAPLHAGGVASVRFTVPSAGSAYGAAAAVGAKLGSGHTLAQSGFRFNPIVPRAANSVLPGLTPSRIAQDAPGMSAAYAPQVPLFVPSAQAMGAAPAAESLRQFVARMDAARQVQGPEQDSTLSDRFFTGSDVKAEAAADSSAPEFPRGVTSVSVTTMRTSADVSRTIPSGKNSDVLKAQLQRDLPKMAPYEVYTYHDSLGGTFTGIDLSGKPALVEYVPELLPHEVKLIKKLQLVSRDIRVLVREDGKTPDLVVGGQVVELKSEMDHFPVTKLVDKANKQILEHGQRHGLGHGALALDLDLPAGAAVPAEKMRGLLDAWQAQTGAVVLDRVLVFGPKDVRAFLRQSDGTYAEMDPASVFAPGAQDRPVRAQDMPRAESWLRSSRPIRH